LPFSIVKESSFTACTLPKRLDNRSRVKIVFKIGLYFSARKRHQVAVMIQDERWLNLLHGFLIFTEMQ
jgi:hypothetical protein